MSAFEEINNEDTADRIEAILPDHALEKVRHLEAIAAERSAIYRNISAKIATIHGKKSEWLTLITRTEREIDYQGAPRTAESVANVGKWNRWITKANDDVKKLTAQQKFEPTLSPHIVFEALQELPPGTVLVDARVPAKISKSENVIDAINASRNYIAALVSKRGAARNALLPKEVALHRAITDIKLAAAKAAPDFTPNARLVRPSVMSRPRQGRTEWPKLSLETGSRLIELEDAAAIVKFALQDSLIVAATESISKLYEGNPLVVPESERDARIAEIDAQILAEARVEEALIEIAEAKGIKVLRRPHAPPFAVLGVAVAPAEDLEFG